MSRLFEIREEVARRVEAIAAARPEWPCRKGCDECCRRLASVPRVSRAEWAEIGAAIRALPPQAAEASLDRIRRSAGASRPVTCPLLDTESGACLIYEARPVACRAYGFYAERDLVLGCSRIESISREAPDVVWGNHAALQERLRPLGPAKTLDEWLATQVASPLEG